MQGDSTDSVSLTFMMAVCSSVFYHSSKLTITTTWELDLLFDFRSYNYEFCIEHVHYLFLYSKINVIMTTKETLYIVRSTLYYWNDGNGLMIDKIIIIGGSNLWQDDSFLCSSQIRLIFNRILCPSCAYEKAPNIPESLIKYHWLFFMR
jgi:hypothetical protein